MALVTRASKMSNLDEVDLSWQQKCQSLIEKSYEERKALINSDSSLEETRAKIFELSALLLANKQSYMIKDQNGCLKINSKNSSFAVKAFKAILTLRLLGFEIGEEKEIELTSLVVGEALTRSQDDNPKEPETSLPEGDFSEPRTGLLEDDSSEPQASLPKNSSEPQASFPDDSSEPQISLEDSSVSEPSFYARSSESLTEYLHDVCGCIVENKISGGNVVEVIMATKQAKLMAVLLTLLVFSFTGKLPDSFKSLLLFLSSEELYVILHKVTPKSYDANLFRHFYNSFFGFFVKAIPSGNGHDRFASAIKIVRKKYFQLKPSDTWERRDRIINQLGLATWDYADCCDRIETRLAVLINEAPIEMCRKMVDLWYLSEANQIISIDDHSFEIYVFTNELSVFYEQFMRMFFILNRIDEVVRGIGYTAYATATFKLYYKTVYLEFYRLFSHLCQALSRNYEIVQVVNEKATGLVKLSPKPDPEIANKLRECTVYMTFPLAFLDSILRLSLEIDSLPVLFNEENERFIFTVKVYRKLPLHDFVSVDRQSFAENIVELYPCLDRHFGHFHKTKKMASQGIDTTLPPSYHKFNKLPPLYGNIDAPVENNDIEDLLEASNQKCTVWSGKSFLMALMILFLIFVLNLLFFY